MNELAVSPGSICPTCEQRIPFPPVPHEDRTPRERQQHNINIPKSAGPGGKTNLLEHLANAKRSALSRYFGYDQKTPDYFVIIPSLHLWSVSPTPDDEEEKA